MIIGFMIVYFAISTLVTFIATISKNIGICILLYLAASFGASIVGAVFQVAAMFVSYESTSYKIVEFVNALNIFTSTLIGAGTTYTGKDVLYILMSPVLTVIGSTLLGLKMFSRKNLK